MSNEPPSGVVTGAASGLGRALAVRLAQDGWQLALCDIDEAGLEVTRHAVEAAGGQACCESLDIRDAAAWQMLRERLERDWTRFDLLVNNAGVCGAGPVGEFPLDDWRWVLEVDLFGAILGCHTFVDWLKRNPGSHILNTASIAGLLAPPSMAAYSVAKAGIIALSESLYGELRPLRVGVTVLCPGFFPSHLIDRGRFSNPSDRRHAEEMMQGSHLTAEQLADRAVRAMRRGRLYVVEGRTARRYWRIKRWLPTTFHRVLSDAVARWKK